MKTLIKAMLRHCGYDLRRYPAVEPAAPSRVAVFLRAWQRLGPPPAFIIDVGANHGAWTREALRFFPAAQYLMIEPQERLKTCSDDLLRGPFPAYRLCVAAPRNPAV